MRAVSEFIAVLIIVALTVGAVVALAFIVTSVLQRHSVSGGDLVVSGGEGYLSGSTLILRLGLVNVGTHPISINGVEVYKGSSKITAQMTTTGCSMVRPETSCDLVVRLYGVSNVIRGDTITVLVLWSDTTTNTSGVTRTTITVS